MDKIVQNGSVVFLMTNTLQFEEFKLNQLQLGSMQVRTKELLVNLGQE